MNVGVEVVLEERLVDGELVDLIVVDDGILDDDRVVLVEDDGDVEELVNDIDKDEVQLGCVIVGEVDADVEVDALVDVELVDAEEVDREVVDDMAAAIIDDLDVVEDRAVVLKLGSVQNDIIVDCMVLDDIAVTC